MHGWFSKSVENYINKIFFLLISKDFKLIYSEKDVIRTVACTFYFNISFFVF